MGNLSKCFIHRRQISRFSRPRHFDCEDYVQNGLAVTPSMMLDMAEHNIPISAQNLGVSYDEGVGKLDFDVPLEYQRGVDIADAWEARERFKNKFRDGLKSEAYQEFLKSQPSE